MYTYIHIYIYTHTYISRQMLRDVAACTAALYGGLAQLYIAECLVLVKSIYTKVVYILTFVKLFI